MLKITVYSTLAIIIVVSVLIIVYRAISPQPTIELTIPNGVLYEVTYMSAWTAETHGDWWIEGAHLSPFVAWTHTEEGIDKVYKKGGLASPGIEDMAETGATDKLIDELTALQNERMINDIQKGSLIYAPGESTVRIRVSEDAPFLSAVSMLAPSPDWFVAVQDLKLFDEERGWVDGVSIIPTDLDAGTDSGKTFTAEDINTDPREPIAILRNAPRTSFARFILKRID